MSVADMRRKVEQDKPLAETGAGLAKRFTNVFYNMLSVAITDIESGKLKAENLNEVQRLYMMWKEIVDYQEMMNSGGSGEGTLPELTSREVKVLDKAGIDTETTERLEDMSDEEVQKFALGLMEASNQNNVDEMNEKNS